MTKEKINEVMMQYKDLVPAENTIMLKNKLEKVEDDAADNLMAVKTYNPIITLILSIFLGALGVDRFYIGDIGTGVAKLLVGWLTFGIWPLIDIFCCYKKAKKKNLNNILTAL